MNFKVKLNREERDVYDIFSFYSELNRELQKYEKNMVGITKLVTTADMKKISALKMKLMKEAPKYRVWIDGKEYNVVYREDDWNYRAKEPNVVFLEKGNEIKFVLREARIYSPNDYEMKHFKKAVFSGETKNFDIDGYKKLFNEEKLIVNPRKYFFIPEPMLIVALKRLEEKYNLKSIVPNITPIPEMREGETGTTNFYYIREYFKERKNILDILGITLSLNLRIFADIDSNFLDIYEEDNRSVIIDPDFILYGGKENREIQEIIVVSKQYGKPIKMRDIERTRERFSGEVNILEFIPEKRDEVLKEFEKWYND